MVRQQIGRVAARARAILLSNKGYTVQQIAFILAGGPSSGSGIVGKALLMEGGELTTIIS